MTEMGEYVAGAYLRMIKGCSIVIYNQKAYEEKGKFEEIDVLGFDLATRSIYLCEVTTHLRGLLYSGGNEATLRRLRKKFRVTKNFGESNFPKLTKNYMFWSPYVPKGRLTLGLEEIRKELKMDIKLVINEEYTKKIRELQQRARTDTKDRGEPFYRALQIIEHLR